MSDVEEVLIVNENSEEISENYKIIVTPWKNKNEFIDVYNLLFSESSNNDSKQKAFDRMIIWKLRRSSMTPASVLSTLELLEVELESYKNSREGELQIMYSSAFTRFINFMTSVSQVKKFKTLYESANELGLESFLIDLRNLCAHGHTMPSLEVFQRSAKYCMNWLKEFYWDHELINFQEVTSVDIRSKTSINFQHHLEDVFIIYDISNEALHKGYSQLNDNFNNNFSFEKHNLLCSYSVNRFDIKSISKHSLQNFLNTIKQEKKLRRKLEIISFVILNKDRYFLQAPNFVRGKNKVKVNILNLYQQLFRNLASIGGIEHFLFSLIKIFESKQESQERRKGAAYWAEKIILGLHNLNKIRKQVKQKMDKTQNMKFEFSSINTNILPNKVKAILKEADINFYDNLIFGDTMQYPIFFTLTKKFIEKRLMNIDKLSINFIKVCLNLTQPPFPEKEKMTILKLINLYVGTKTVVESEEKMDVDVYLNGDADEIYSLDTNGVHELEENIGKRWKTNSCEIDWSKLVLGNMPGDVNNNKMDQEHGRLSNGFLNYNGIKHLQTADNNKIQSFRTA